ncbi:MAG: MBL fold metallo-hydrolase [Acidimicrobiales bacterium]
MVEIVTVDTPGLGDRSYLVHDGELAIVVDPQRDTDRIDALVDSIGLRVTLVVETHIHNDYVTGGYALAQETGATYVVAAGDNVAFDRTAAHDGDRFEAGRLSITVRHTPGHTPNHLSYVLSEGDGEPVAVFTGGSMLFGAVGRTDLVSPDRTEELTRAQYRSVRGLADGLADGVTVYPTHGFGSFCSATTTTGDASTVGQERRQNVALVTDDEDAFVQQLMGGLNAYPRYYAHMGPLNTRGPQAPDLAPPVEVDPAELRRRIDRREWVVDLRSRRAFARRHVAGTISVELDDAFATYLGWIVPWGTPLTLIGDTADQVAEAQRQLTRIGIDHLAGQASGATEALAAGHIGSYEVTNLKGLAAAWGEENMVVLDVRRPDEWAAGHLEGSTHIPFWELEERVGEVPAGDVWVYCASGYRASIGSSILDRAGRHVVHVDDDWDRAAELSLPVES